MGFCFKLVTPMPVLRNCWQDGDDTPYRIVDKYPFKIVGSQLFPIADFDKGRPNLSEPNRVYQTTKGWRIFYTGRFNPNLDEMLETMLKDGCDPLYVRFAKRRRYYSSRIDPKIRPEQGSSYCVARFVKEHGTRNSAWDEFIAFFDERTGAHNGAEMLI